MTVPADVNDRTLYDGLDAYLPKDCNVTVLDDSRLFIWGEVYLNGQPIVTGGSPPSGVEVHTGPTSPVDTGIKLWWDTSGQGGYGVLKVRDPTDQLFKNTDLPPTPVDPNLNNEVYIGGTEPAQSYYELWVDTATEAPSPTVSSPNPYNSLGIVATGSFTTNLVSCVADETKVITNPLVISLINGRRYKICCGVRAAGMGTTKVATYRLLDNGAIYPGTTDVWRGATVDYSGPGHIEWQVRGDGQTHSFTVTYKPNSTAGGVYTDADSYYYLEDIGLDTSKPVEAIPAAVNPYNALGIIAVGSLLGGQATIPVAPGNITVTNPLSVSLINGRQYKIAANFRAVHVDTATDFLQFYLWDGGVAYPGTPEQWFQVPTGYSGRFIEWHIVGDGNTHSFAVNIRGGNNVGTVYLENGPQSKFYVEDLGPLSRSGQSSITPPPDIPVPWTNATLLNSWTNAGGGRSSASYRKIGDVVQLRGAIKNATPMVNPSSSTIAILPSGYRPPASVTLSITAAASDGWWGPMVMEIDPLNGNVYLFRGAQTATQPHAVTDITAQFSVTP